MPSQLHEALVELLRGHPELVLELLRPVQDVNIAEGDTIVSDSAELGTTISPELSADCLLRLERDGRTRLVVVVEVQLNLDLKKSFSWPAYAIGARTRHRCDVVLMVVTPHENVANWARKKIIFGPDTGHLQPYVIGPQEMPAIVDPEKAKQTPELAVLSAITHGHDDDIALAVAVADAAMAATFCLTDHRAQVYYDLIRAALSEAAREALQMIPQNYVYQDEGLRRAKAEGVLEGKLEGELEGQLKATSQALFEVFAARDFQLNHELRSRILACRDVVKLRSWLSAAVNASSAETALID
jgi:hypothetical protein